MVIRFIALWMLWVGAEAQAASVLKVVSTFSVLSDLIAEVGGDAVEVRTIVPCNADPHTYEPLPSDSVACAKADLIFINGLTFEGWIDRLIEASGYKGEIINASALIQPRHLTTQGQPAIDPHAWHNVQNTISYVVTITKALRAALPESEQNNLNKRSAVFIQKLHALDQWVRNQFADISNNKRLVVTTHDAFWYYGEAYQVIFLSPVGISTEAQPSAKAIAELIETIRLQNIKAIFIENLANSKLIEQIAKESLVSVDGVLFADSLSEKGGVAESYISMIKYNTLQIVTALKA